MTRNDLWHSRAREERGLILQILYQSPTDWIAAAVIDGAARAVLMPIEREHLRRHLLDMTQRDWIEERVSESNGLRLRMYALRPAGRDLVMGANVDLSIDFPAELI